MSFALGAHVRSIHRNETNTRAHTQNDINYGNYSKYSRLKSTEASVSLSLRVCAFSVGFRSGPSLIGRATTIKTVRIAFWAWLFSRFTECAQPNERPLTTCRSNTNKNKLTPSPSVPEKCSNCLWKYCWRTQFYRIVHAQSLRQVFNQISWNNRGWLCSKCPSGVAQKMLWIENVVLFRAFNQAKHNSFFFFLLQFIAEEVRIVRSGFPIFRCIWNWNWTEFE